MTKFIKENFYGTEYVDYNLGDKSLFVARFKRGGRASFLKFLIANFTVEEYFSRLAAGEAPGSVLQSKGYLPAHIKRMLKEQGYPVSLVGYEQLRVAEMQRLTV